MQHSPSYVVFDLETIADQPDASDHEIVQIGAVRTIARGGIDEFSTLVRPERRLPLHVTEKTGLEFGDLELAPSREHALTEFFDWVGDRPIIAHNGFGYDFLVLDASASTAGIAVPRGPRLDTLELAHLVFPRAGANVVRNVDDSRPPAGRDLDCLALLAGFEKRAKHDALADARIARAVMLTLLEELNRPTQVRRLQRWVLGQVRHPWSDFLDRQSDPVALSAVVPMTPTPPPVVPSGSLDVADIVADFGAGGSLMTDNRTPRPQQAEMAELVALAFARPNTRLMIEAPTGTGKTLAYLVPAIEAARASGSLSVVAPHSRVLQDQILETLEGLTSVLAPFSLVVLKGRRNYISLDALQRELEAFADETAEGAAEYETAMALSILCGWVAQTPTGDWADLRTNAIEDRVTALQFFRWKLRVESLPRPAPDALDRLDFYRRARQRLSGAHVAVLNHALLATGPALDGREFNLLVDEAHDLEDSITAACTRQVDVEQLEHLCAAIWASDHRRGLAPRIARATRMSPDDEALGLVRAATQAARMAIAGLSAPLVEYVRDRTGITREQAVRYGASHRIVRGADRHHATYRAALDAGGVLRDALRRVADALDVIHIPPGSNGRSRSDALEEEKARLGREARDSAELIDAVLWAESQLRLIDDDLDDDTDLLSWVNVAEVRFVRPDAAAGWPAHGLSGTREAIAAGNPNSETEGQWRWQLRRAPVSVASLLDDVWENSGSVVLTSATLSVDTDFSFLIDRLGFNGAEAKSIPSPFTDLAERHLVLLTDYLPSPRGQLIDRFTETEASEIPRLCVASDGGVLALMAARTRLEYVRDHARPHLAPLGIELLAQDGDAGSAAALIDRMQEDMSACLLGLRSFWEGVDIRGDALRQLIVEKIPFDPMGEPLVNARMDLLELQGKDPFAHYLVPRAAIALAQGTGRLIRSATDRGVTVILDNRLRRPLDYADRMRRSLAGPPELRPVDTPHEAYRAIAQHLGLAYDEARRSRIDRIPGVATLSATALDIGDPEAPMDDADIERRLEIARMWLGFDAWRPGQREVMTRFMRNEDVVAVLPTGSGKSVTYQIPALVSPGVTVVVSPLVALMRDQVDNLRARGVNEAAAIHTGIGQAEQQAVLRAAAQGHVKLLYVSPERLWSPAFLNLLRDVNVVRVAVDEAHCISLWGHSFRPEYASIPRALEAAVGGRLPVAAVTATATPDVLDDIAELLGMAPAGGPLVGSVDRPEIRYFVENCRNRRDRDLRVAQIMESFRRRSAIVYVPTRNDTVRLTALLRTFGHRVRPYSGAMELTERQHTEDAFRHDEIDVVVATKAFGLGIDKPDIAVIVHLEMPASIEEYVQETGRLARGARDGTGPEIGTAVLLVTDRDCRIHEHFVRSSAPDIEVVRQTWSELANGVNFIDPERQVGDNGTEDGERDESLMLALHYLEQVGAVRRHRDFVMRGRLTATEAAARTLEELRTNDADFAAKAERILNLAEREGGDYSGLRWQTLLEMAPSDIEEMAFELQRLGVCSYTSWRYGWAFERVATSAPDWSRLSELIEERRRIVHLRAREARELAHGRPACRRREMLRYLGEAEALRDETASCGACDACTPELPRPWTDSAIAVEDVADAVRSEAAMVALILIDGAEAGQWSRRNLARTLRGESGGKFPLNEMLRVNGCFGRLAPLSAREVDDLFEDLIADGCLEQFTPEGRDYSSLRLTSEGRRLVAVGSRT